MTTTTTAPVGVAALPILKPWAAMTPAEQAEHLVYDHGINLEYFDRLAVLPDDAAVVVAFTTEVPGIRESADGYSFPHPADRDTWHADDDHDYRYGGSWSHKHAPGSPLTRVPEAARVHRHDLEG